MEEASATVELRPCNAVTAVAMDAATVPMAPVPAGKEMSVLVDLETEDKSHVPLADALKGLTLQLMAPGGKARAAQVYSGMSTPSKLTFRGLYHWNGSRLLAVSLSVYVT